MIFFLVFTALTAHAQLDDKTAIKEAEADLKHQTELLKSKCGAKNLAIKVNWPAYSKLKGYAESVDRPMPDLMRLASGHVGQVTAVLVDLCSDADFKAEIAKLTMINYTPVKSSEQIFSIKKVGTTLQYESDAQKFDASKELSDKVSNVF